MPESGKIYAFNEGNYGGWEQGLQDYMMSLKDADKHGGKPYSARYITRRRIVYATVVSSQQLNLVLSLPCPLITLSVALLPAAVAAREHASPSG